MSGISCKIISDERLKVISEILTQDTIKNTLKYNYQKDRVVQIEILRDDNKRANMIVNKFNENNDLCFDGHYTIMYQYDNKGNWITKSCYNDKKLEIKYKREIKYY